MKPVAATYRTLSLRLGAALLYALATWGPLPAAAQGCPGNGDQGMGGTGVTAGAAPEGGGLGGTGILGQESGIGGTGIVGVITGLGSICVNGLEIEYDATTAVRRDGERAAAGSLARGQVVSVQALGRGPLLQAASIDIRNEVFGRIEAVGPEAGAFRVLRQEVRSGPWTVFPDSRGGEGLREGEPVRVSGFRAADGRVLATRVERTTALREVGTFGAVGRLTREGFEVNGLPVRLAEGADAEGLREGAEVLACGAWDGERLTALELFRDPVLTPGGHERHMAVQGLVTEVGGGDGFRLGTLRVLMGSATRILNGNRSDLRLDTLVRVEGKSTPQGALRAERVLIDGPWPPRSGSG
jgi:hypothetical protein